MNYPSLSLSVDEIEKAFSGDNTKSLAKTNLIKKDNYPQYETTFKNGKARTCDHCDYKASIFEDLYDHTKKNHVKQKLKCPECDFSKRPIVRVKAHLYQVHLKIGTMKKCDQCDYENFNYNNLYVHKRTYHMEDMKQKCSQCDKTYHYQSKLKQHFNQVHLKIGRKNAFSGYKIMCRFQSCPDFKTTNCKEIEAHARFFCEYCPFSSRSRNAREGHVQFEHEGVVFKCDLCTECSVKTKRALDRHMKSKHPSPEQTATRLFCEENECTYTTCVDFYLKRHIKERHSGEIMYKCDVMNCSYGTEHKKDFRYHTKCHTKKQIAKHYQEPKYNCSECDFVETSKDRMKTHSVEMHSSQEEQSNKMDQSPGLKKCEKCGYKADRNRNFMKHMDRKDHADIQHKCDQCDFWNNSFRKLNSHKQQNHPKSVGYLKKCDQCEFKTEDLGSLRLHLKDHIDLKLNCKICEISFQSRKRLKKHMIKSHGEPMYNCKLCEYTSFSQRKNLWKHNCKPSHEQFNELGLPDESSGLQKGEYCGFKMTLNENVLAHRERKDSEEVQHKCNQCDFVGNSVWKLRRHNREMHLTPLKDLLKGEPKYKCKLCQFTCFSMRNLKKHRSEIHFQPKYNCTECEFSSCSTKKLKKHKEDTHHESTYDCNDCEFTVDSKSKLSQHKRKVHLIIDGRRKPAKSRDNCELPEKSKFQNGNPQKCDKCDYETAQYYNMRVHIRKVHFDLKHKCTECDYSHLFFSMVKKHFQTKHLKIMPHTCTVCDFSHLFPGVVKRHFKAKHLKISPKEEEVDPSPILSPGTRDCTILIDENSFLILNK